MHEDYRLFAHIVEAGSLSEAGRRLHLSPAMMSKRLGRIEARLGARLINRTTRKLTPTEAGQAFYEDVIAILAAAELAEARVAGRTEHTGGRLRVAAPTSFGRMRLAPYLGRFLEDHPRIELELELGDDFADLISERLDAAIRITRPPETSVAAHLLCPNLRLLCASPAYIAAHGAPARLEDLTAHRLLATTGQSPWRVDGPDGRHAIPVASAVRTNSSEVIRELALAGVGLALRSLWDVSADLAAGRLVRVLPQVQGATDVGIYVVHSRSTLVSANIRAFVRFLQGLYARPAWGERL